MAKIEKLLVCAETKFIASLLMTILCSACAGNAYDIERDIADQPPMFQQGYRDGCESGYEAAGNETSEFKRGEAYFSEDLYKQGWDEGFTTCRSQLDTERDLQRLIDHK